MIIILGSLTFGYVQYTNKNIDLATQKPDVCVAAPILYTEYSSNEIKANEKYLNKLTCAKGILRAVDKDNTDMASIALDAGDSLSAIFCQLDPRHTTDIDHLAIGDTVEVKGICAGMLSDVLLIECSAKGK